MLSSPFAKLSKPEEKKWSIVLLVLLLVFVVLMRYFDAPLKNENCTNGIVSFELAREIETSKIIINSWNEQAKTSAYLSLGFDFIFLIIYALFIGLSIHKIVKRLKENSFFFKLGKFLIWTIFLAAVFDIFENIALLQLLSNNLHHRWSLLAYYLAIFKFAILLICILYILVGIGILAFKKIKR